MEEEDKFRCPIQATTNGSRAWKIVVSLWATAENYSKGIETEEQIWRSIPDTALCEGASRVCNKKCHKQLGKQGCSYYV